MFSFGHFGTAQGQLVSQHFCFLPHSAEPTHEMCFFVICRIQSYFFRDFSIFWCMSFYSLNIRIFHCVFGMAQASLNPRAQGQHEFFDDASGILSSKRKTMRKLKKREKLCLACVSRCLAPVSRVSRAVSPLSRQCLALSRPCLASVSRCLAPVLRASRPVSPLSSLGEPLLSQKTWPEAPGDVLRRQQKSLAGTQA